MNVRVLVLGLLRRQPMHGYELRRVAADSRIESWSGVLPGSIYHALKTMEREGLIAPIKDRDQGARTRSVYAITPAGRQALKRLVREALDRPIRSFPADLYGGLLNLDAVSAQDVDRAVERQIGELEAEIARWIAARPMKKPMSWETGVLFDNGIEHLRIDLRTLERLRVGRARRAR